MQKLFLSLFLILLTTFSPGIAHAQTAYPSANESGLFNSFIGGISKSIVPTAIQSGTEPSDWFLSDACAKVQNINRYIGGGCNLDASGNAYNPGLLGIQHQIIAGVLNNQVSSQEYFADVLDNIGVPSVSRAYAQGTGYNAMTSFLPFWKVFRNLAYSLYIIMFMVVGIMIMLRTKVNAQTVITIQSALPNLLITLILITFSYAIVGFMIDLMYFLIYLVVYLIGSAGIIDSSKMITRLLSHSAWSVIFEGRNSIISAVSGSLGGILWGLGTGGLGIAGAVISMVSPMYLIVAVAFAIAMIKLMVALIKAYIMVIVQTVTAPVQILLNAMPGSKSFSTWLKTTAAYLIPFPVAAAMFIFSAILVGNPADGKVLEGFGGDKNPFGVDQNADIYKNRQNIWLPPFTLTDAKASNSDVLTLIGFFIFLMTPSAVKMAQEWLQVKESPYASEAVQGFVGIASTPIKGAGSIISHRWQEKQQRKLYGEIGKNMKAPDPREAK